ncbi:MAG TPA: hypothetical protein VK841_09175 [Polyangiaceae bacterium]|jgi:hypothetical protein|nr:hypothetical protein [Polyangiaceae bacterium]
MAAALSALVAILCAAAAARELARAVAPTFCEPALLARAIAWSCRVEAMASDDAAAPSYAGLPGLARRMATLAPGGWETALFEAFLEREPVARDARVNELLTELDGVTERGARLPGACARIALSSGFLFATMGLLGASLPAVGTGSVISMLAPALNSIALGAAGAAFCAAVHTKARAARRRSRTAFDSLVMTLQSCNLSESR